MKTDTNDRYSRFDELTSDLCREIDQWRNEADYWKAKYEEERNNYSELLNQQMASAKQGVANALMFALHVNEDGNGNLIIDSDSRKQLAESYKS